MVTNIYEQNTTLPSSSTSINSTDGIKYLDTHNEEILGRQRPDFIIVDNPFPNQKPLPMSIISIGELKLYSGDLFIRDAGIQSHRYAREILKRTSRNSIHIFGISPASIFALRFFMVGSSLLECVHTPEYPWNDFEAMRLLAFMLFPPLQHLSTLYDYRPLKVSGFKVNSFLGHGATSNVCEIENDKGERFAFKFSRGTSRDIRHEVEILEELGETHYPLAIKEKFELKTESISSFKCVSYS
jgi:hypothetical protein